MDRWARHWATFPTRFHAGDHLRQVGKTVGGRPIAVHMVDRIVDSIADGLDLRPQDRLLDLGCGNGLITRRLAARCREVVAVDYSRPLLDVARRDHAAQNIRYVETSALELATLSEGTAFDKVVLYEALQHFVPAELPRLLQGVREITRPGFVLMLGSVPDRGRRGRFYNTPWRGLVALGRGLLGRDALGTWWERRRLENALAGAGLAGRFAEQPAGLHTAHYRFDVIAVDNGGDAG